MSNIEKRSQVITPTETNTNIPDGNLAKISRRVDLLPTYDGATAAAQTVYAIYQRRNTRDNGGESPYLGQTAEAEGILFDRAMNALGGYYEETGAIPIASEGGAVISVGFRDNGSVLKPRALGSSKIR